MKNIIIHVPHSSLKLPKIFLKKTLLSKEDLLEENLTMCDLYVDKLLGNRHCYKIMPKYSRLFCDVEKFKDESKEKMAAIGMGPVYTKTSNGQDLIKYDNAYKEMVLSEYYDKHHARMDELIDRILKRRKECFIIDLHSFSNNEVEKTLKEKDCPDICVGIDDDFSDPVLNDMVISYLKECGYDVRINYPYVGSFVPNVAYNNKYTNVKSIMIEVNENMYLDGFTINKEKFNSFKTNLNKLLDKIVKYTNSK